MVKSDYVKLEVSLIITLMLENLLISAPFLWLYVQTFNDPLCPTIDGNSKSEVERFWLLKQIIFVSGSLS